MSSDTPLYVYVQGLYQALEKQRPYVTYNRDKIHAGVVVAAGFRYAREHIRILSHSLDFDVYKGVVVESAREFLSRSNSRLSVLVESDIVGSHPLRELANDFSSSVDIRRVPDDLQERYQCNFMTMDEFGYRFEPDRGLCNATVVVHDKSHLNLLSVLIDLYDKLRDRSNRL